MDVKNLTEQAARDWLRTAASVIPDDLAIVEIGVYQGGSLAALAEGAQLNGATVYGIDPWAGECDGLDSGPADMALAQQAAPTARLIVGLSADVAAAWNGPPVGLLYVDGQHTYDAVLADFHGWRRHMTPQAFVAFDDYATPWPWFAGVTEAVDSLAEDGWVEPIRVVGKRLAVTRLNPRRSR